MNCDKTARLDKYQYQQLADEICRIFTKEHPSAYYIPFGDTVGSTAKGKLFEQYNKYRQQLGRQGLIKLRERKKPNVVAMEKRLRNPVARIEVPLSDATSQKLRLLSQYEIFSEKFMRTWDSLRDYRNELILAERTPKEMYEIFPCLRHPNAHQLAFHDSARKYNHYATLYIPDSFTDTLVDKIPIFYRTKDGPCKVYNILQIESDMDRRSIVSVALLPLLYNPGKKCSKLDTFQRFIQVKDTIDDVVFEESGPTIAFIGNPLATKGILKIEDNIYEFDSIRTCMEAYCAFNLAYNFPFLPRCRLIWFFVRRHLFNISKRDDKEGDTLTMAHDLGLM